MTKKIQKCVAVTFDVPGERQLNSWFDEGWTLVSMVAEPVAAAASSAVYDNNTVLRGRLMVVLEADEEGTGEG